MVAVLHQVPHHLQQLHRSPLREEHRTPDLESGSGGGVAAGHRGDTEGVPGALGRLRRPVVVVRGLAVGIGDHLGSGPELGLEPSARGEDVRPLLLCSLARQDVVAQGVRADGHVVLQPARPVPVEELPFGPVRLGRVGLGHQLLHGLPPAGAVHHLQAGRHVLERGPPLIRRPQRHSLLRPSHRGRPRMLEGGRQLLPPGADLPAEQLRNQEARCGEAELAQHRAGHRQVVAVPVVERDRHRPRWQRRAVHHPLQRVFDRNDVRDLAQRRELLQEAA